MIIVCHLLHSSLALGSGLADKVHLRMGCGFWVLPYFPGVDGAVSKRLPQTSFDVQVF